MKLSGTIGVTQKTMTLDTHVRLIFLQTLNPQERWGTHKKRWPFQPRLFADVIGLVRCSYAEIAQLYTCEHEHVFFFFGGDGLDLDIWYMYWICSLWYSNSRIYKETDLVRFLASPMASKVAPMVDNSRVEVGVDTWGGDPREMPMFCPFFLVRFGYVMDVSLNGGTPISHPKMIIFSRKTHGFVGETHHFRKPPYHSFSRFKLISSCFILVHLMSFIQSLYSWYYCCILWFTITIVYVKGHYCLGHQRIIDTMIISLYRHHHQ